MRTSTNVRRGPGGPSSPTTTNAKSGAAAGGKDQQQIHQSVSWNKTHKLEGDCLITGFYDFLLLRNNETMKPCTEVLIPDTIVYDHNFPRGWYTTDTDKSLEVMKRQGTDLDSSKVLEFFSKPSSKNCGIVASYMSCTDEDDVITTSVEFFNQHTLKEFVERKTKREGILQKFLIPKGGTRNTVIQAVWSPNPNAFFVWRRTNRMNLDNKPQWERDPYPMCVTYDGPSHYSEEGTCALQVKKEIRAVCERVVNHFFQVYEKEKVITRLVLYFKLDENDKLWLLWCGGLRVADANSAQVDPSKNTVPLNLAPKYTDSSVEARKETNEMTLLGATNKKYIQLKKSVQPDQNANHNNGHSKSSPSKLDAAGGGSPHRSPNATVNNARTFGAAGATNNNNNNNYDDDFSNKDGTSNNNKNNNLTNNNNNNGAGGGVDDDDDHHSNKESTDKDAFWKKHPPIYAQYLEFCNSRDVVISYLDDVFYEAYGHFLRYDPGPFTFEVDKKIAGMLGNDPLGEAMSAGGVQKAAPSENGMTSIDDEDLCFEIQPKHPNGPVSKIGDAVKKWINNHYDKLILDLKEEAASLAPPSGIVTSSTAASSNKTGANSSSPPQRLTAAQQRQQQQEREEQERKLQEQQARAAAAAAAKQQESDEEDYEGPSAAGVGGAKNEKKGDSDDEM